MLCNLLLKSWWSVQCLQSATTGDVAEKKAPVLVMSPSGSKPIGKQTLDSRPMLASTFSVPEDG